MASQMNKQSIYAFILLITKEGASKKEVAKTLSISNPQRRLTAGLVDKVMVRMDAIGRLVTTDKGHIFLKHNR